jgi:hypothetical protein
LCLYLGYKHPDLMLADLTSAQLADWRAFAEVERFGDIWTQRSIGIFAARVMNALYTKRSEPFTEEDILPWLKDQSEPDLIDLDPDSQVAVFDRMFRR